MRFQNKNKNDSYTSYNRSGDQTQQTQPHCIPNQAPQRANSSAPMKTNYSKYTTGSSKNDMHNQKMTTNPMGSSKFPAHPNQPSTDKAGNPICFKCGKIGFARDCPKHPYKPRVYALGVMEVDETLGNLPEESEEVPEEQVEFDSTKQNVTSVDEEDIYMDDPY